MLAAFLTSMLVTITRIVQLLSTMEELAYYGVWATAHRGAVFRPRERDSARAMRGADTRDTSEVAWSRSAGSI